MNEPGSITCWIDLLDKGDEAAREIWQRFFLRLVSLAKKKLLSSRQRVRDSEDVVLDAFDSFFRRAVTTCGAFWLSLRNARPATRFGMNVV